MNLQNPDSLMFRSLDSLDRFVRDTVLPVWLSAGFDQERRMFVEELTLDGRPLLQIPRRMRVQARQIYTFSCATLAGFIDASAVLPIAFRQMVSFYWHPGGGWMFSADRNGAPTNTTRFSYEQAFAIMASAGMFRLTGEEFYLAWAEQTFAFLDNSLGDPVHGGYQQSIPGGFPRSQNPHMHLFEACLNIFEATGRDQYLGRAARLYDLFAHKFFNLELGAVREYFGDDWSNTAEGAERLLDPGHQFEWVWLLDRYTKLTGIETPERETIFEFALRHGSDPADNLVYQEIDLAGHPVRPTKRMWSQTEKLRALIIQFEVGNPLVTPELIGEFVETGLGRYLQTEHGTWTDVIGETTAGEVSPASTLYHLYGCYAESRRLLPDN